MTGPRYDTIVIGAGVIGLAIAWRAAQRGLTAAIADPRPGAGASHAAAGHDQTGLRGSLRRA